MCVVVKTWRGAHASGDGLCAGRKGRSVDTMRDRRDRTWRAGSLWSLSGGLWLGAARSRHLGRVDVVCVGDRGRARQASLDGVAGPSRFRVGQVHIGVIFGSHSSRAESVEL